MKRGEIWWADLADSEASEPGFRRPLLIVQIDNFNRSCIRTVVVVILTSNLRLSEAPGNVFLKSVLTELPKDSVANVSQVLTVDKSFLTEKAGKVRKAEMQKIEAGLKLLWGL